MKRTEIRPGAVSLERGSTFRTPHGAIRSTPSRRDWTQARAKVDGEVVCRVCSRRGHIDAAHVVSRAKVSPGDGEHPDNIVPLCRDCHDRFDAGRLDLLAHLTRLEVAHAVLIHPYGLFGALHRMTGRRWMPAPGSETA